MYLLFSLQKTSFSFNFFFSFIFPFTKHKWTLSFLLYHCCTKKHFFFLIIFESKFVSFIQLSLRFKFMFFLHFFVYIFVCFFMFLIFPLLILCEVMHRCTDEIYILIHDNEKKNAFVVVVVYLFIFTPLLLSFYFCFVHRKYA